jgi:hypothetical protein
LTDEPATLDELRDLRWAINEARTPSRNLDIRLLEALRPSRVGAGEYPWFTLNPAVARDLLLPWPEDGTAGMAIMRAASNVGHNGLIFMGEFDSTQFDSLTAGSTVEALVWCEIAVVARIVLLESEYPEDPEELAS